MEIPELCRGRVDELRVPRAARAAAGLARPDVVPPPASALDVLQAVSARSHLPGVAALGLCHEACRHLGEALDQLDRTWYSVAMDRVRSVRRQLHHWKDEPCMRDLDDRLFGWDTTLTAIRS
jgi:hypothetical protein